MNEELLPRAWSQAPSRFLCCHAARLIRRQTVNIFAHTAIGDWGKVRRINSDEGDTVHLASMIAMGDDSRDGTYVRVSGAKITVR